jgi:hypothetical protein
MQEGEGEKGRTGEGGKEELKELEETNLGNEATGITKINEGRRCDKAPA